jgi:hypothetical protein
LCRSHKFNQKRNTAAPTQVAGVYAYRKCFKFGHLSPILPIAAVKTKILASHKDIGVTLIKKLGYRKTIMPTWCHEQLDAQP